MKQQTRRIFAAFLSIVLTLSLCPWALADYPADTRTGVEGDYTGKTVILHSNDVHGEIMGYAYIAALKTEFQNKGADVILADAGDFSQGDPTVSLSKGADAVAMMNAAGYDVATLGNHEFDFGYAQLMENLQAADFPVICADVFEGGKTILPPTWTYEKDGLKIGFFGMETPETQTKVNPGLIQGIRFLSKGDIYTCAQEQIDALRSDGADVVIALAHLGVDAESAPDGHRSVDMYAHTQGIDLILDGHSHTVMTAGESGEPVQSTGTKFANIGVVVIDNEKEAIEDHYLIPTKVTETVEEDGKEVEKVVSELSKDAAVEAKAQEIIDRVAEQYGEVIGQTEVLLNGARSPGNRTEETNLGDLITDAIVWKVLEANRKDGKPATLTVGDKSVDEDHIVGITNGGGIRASIGEKTSDVKRVDLNTVLPFGNTIAVVFVTGAELLEALEASTYATPEALGGYPQTFGIEFTLDTTKPYAQGEAYPESTYYSPAFIERVTITKINGEPFDPAATYAVVTNNFCAAGGDTYYVFKNASAQFDTGIVMDEAVMEYIQGPLKGVISKETYGEPRGDQTIILAQPTDEPENDDITILYTNDIHTYIDNTRKNDAGETVSALRYSTVAGYRQSINADFLVDAGDHIQGTSYGTYDEGYTIIRLMNAAGYTAATLGNHEFDYDMDGTRSAIAWADFDYVSCNIINTDGTQLLPSYKVYEAANGKKVAFVGITTPESITKSTPAYFMNENGEIVWSFSEGDEGAKLYAVVQSAIDAASAEADYVIGVGHMGVDEGSAPYTSEDVIRNTTGFTAFIDGHSHTKMEMQKVADKSGKEIVLTQTKCYLEYVGEMTIDAAGNVTTELHDAVELKDVTPDASVKAIEDEIIGILAEEQDRVIGHTDVALNIYNGDERLVRKQETAIGNFCADATYAYFNSRGYDIDAAFMNGGGIRNPLDGDITVKTLKDIYPWGNVLCLVDMTGQQILDGLEFGSKNVNPEGTGESGGFLHVSGLKYEINAAIPDTTQSDENGIWIGGPTGDYRVSNVQVKNRQTGAYEPLELDKHYSVGGINYTLRQLGDGFAMFTGENIVDGVAVDYMALDEYVKTFPVDSATGLPTLKAGMGYDAPEGRIVIKTDKETDSTASPVEARFHFSPSIPGGAQADAPVTFNPSWFFQSARSNYQSGLAQLSIRTAMAAFGTDAVLESDDSAEPVRYLSEEAKDSTSANIVRLMRDLGFSKITADYQNPGLDTIGYAIANREISNEAGETARLILIAVRGGGYRQEWASNFTIGLSKEHQGFSEAASMVFETAQAYLSELRQDGYSGAVKFWITGYSRGAAVANLTARLLTDLSETDSGFTRDDVFACCLACPRNAILDSATASAYDNIVNVVHYADFVPKIPVAPWGYVRYGKTYYLPDPELTAQYAEASGKMAQSLSAFLGAIQPQPDTTVTQQYLWGLTHLLNNQGRLTDRFTDTLAVHVGSQSGYVNMVQDAFRNAIEASEGRDGFGAFFQVLTGLPGYAERYQQSILPITENGTQISLAHAPELYLAWLDALESAASYGRSRVLVVNGPADVTVLDESGATAAQITASGAADSVLPAYIDPDGQKIVSLPADGTFRIELTASENGAVSYQIEETDLETGVTDRLTGYYEIPVTAGDRLSGTADALASGVRGEYPLRSADGAALTLDADSQEAARNCSVSISVRDESETSGERHGFAQGGGRYVPGEYAQAIAIPAEKSVFLGWYENGELISNDAQFRFLVTADRELTAVFAEEKPSYQVSVTDGDGSGTYQEGDSVSIAAKKAPDGQVFDKWLGADGLNFISGNQNSDNATFAMPGNDVTLTATFRAQSAQGGQSGQNSRGGCYVATAVYGSYDCPEVWTLRRFRDGVLAKTWYGRLFIRLYYAVSPTAVKLFGDCEWFQSFFRDRLDKMVSGLQADGFESTPYQDRAW